MGATCATSRPNWFRCLRPGDVRQWQFGWTCGGGRRGRVHHVFVLVRFHKRAVRMRAVRVWYGVRLCVSNWIVCVGVGG